MFFVVGLVVAAAALFMYKVGAGTAALLVASVGVGLMLYQVAVWLP